MEFSEFSDSLSLSSLNSLNSLSSLFFLPSLPFLFSLYLYQSILNGVDYQVGGVAAAGLFEDVGSMLIYSALRDK